MSTPNHPNPGPIDGHPSANEETALADRLDRALESLWGGDTTGFDRLIETEGDEPKISEMLGNLAAEAGSGATLGSPPLGTQSESAPGAIVRGRTAAESESLPTNIGGYEIVRQIGRGGMGVVYEAHQKVPARRVALKVLRRIDVLDDFRVKLFQREIETMARLKHPGIAVIYEAGRTADGQHFFAMEFVDGLPLDQHLKLPRPHGKARSDAAE